MLENLEKKYDKKLPVENMTEKDIIYFCRDALSLLSKPLPEDIIKYEKEILNLIKSKEWDWQAQDMDKNTILTYPILNNSFAIVKYLIENKKYDLNEYSQSMSNSIQSCVMLNGLDMQNYLLTKNINPEYITDLSYRIYNIMAYCAPQYVEIFSNMNKNLIKLNINFDKILSKFMGKDEHGLNETMTTFIQFLEEHPLSINEKVKKVQDSLLSIKESLIKENQNKNELQKTKIIDKFDYKYLKLKKWLQYYELEESLKPKDLNIKKLKI